MAIDKINFSYPKGTLQSVFDNEALTALELSAKTSKKVDECVEIVNGVEQTAIEATAIVDDMYVIQNQFVTDNSDTRAQLINDNQAYIDGLTASKTQFETDLNASKELFETNLNNEVQTIVDNADTAISTNVNNKIDALFNDGTIPNMINVDTEKAIAESTGTGVISGLEVLQQSSPNMSVLISSGIAHLHNGKRYEQTENKTINIDVADPNFPRIDIIYVNSMGVLSYGKGTAEAIPTPLNPMNSIILAEIYVNVGTSLITSLLITDKRQIKMTNNGIKSEIEAIKEILSRNVVNIKNFGAKGDGIANDTQAFKNALSSINYNGAIYLPKGTYLVSETINIDIMSDLMLFGDNMYMTALKYTGISSFINSGGGGRLFAENMTFISDFNKDVEEYKVGTTAINIVGAVLSFKGVRLSGFDTLINWSGGYYHTFHDCRFDHANKCLNNFNANNLYIDRVRVETVTTFLTANGGEGPINITNSSFELVHERICSLSEYATLNFIGNYVEDWDSDKTVMTIYGGLIINMIGNTFQLTRTRRLIYDYNSLNRLISIGNFFNFQKDTSSLEFIFYLSQKIKTFISHDHFRIRDYSLNGIYTTQFTNNTFKNYKMDKLDAYDGIQNKPIENIINTTLLNGWTTSTNTALSVPTYEIINNRVYLKGGVNGVNSTDTTVLNVPIYNHKGYQYKTLVDENGRTYKARLLINGDIKIETIDELPVGDNIDLSGLWFSI